MSDVLIRKQSYVTSLLTIQFVIGLSAPATGAVVLNEIHYEPPEGAALEFVEIHNTGRDPVSLVGWSLSNGVDLVLGEGVMIEGNGFLVVARDPDELAAHFGLPRGGIPGPFEGALDNGGERLELSNAQGVAVDSVRYDDDAPWDSRAAGQGPSLQRLCATFDSESPANWIAKGTPSPLAATPDRGCPPPGPPPPRIGINEILYHSTNLNDAHEELVELRNNTTAAINLRGHAFSEGIDFKFEEDVLVQPGETIAVCRDAEHVKKVFGAPRAHGNFMGQLSNDGERITLVDGAGAIVDSVRYRDGGEWPVAADGLGSSLEKISPEASSADPMSWKASDSPGGRNRQRVVVRGIATSTVLAFRLDGFGECLIDNLSLVDTADPGRNLILNGTFDQGLATIDFEGSHFASGWDPTGGTDGTGALRLKSKDVQGGKGQERREAIIDGSIHRATISLGTLVRVNGPTYELAFDFAHATGWRGFTASFVDATPERGAYWRFDPKPSATPARANTVLSDRLPPLVTDVSRWPGEPTSTDPVAISARIRSRSAITSVKLLYNIDLKPPAMAVDAFDDGTHGDAEAGDGVYGARLPSFPHNTAVTFRIEVRDAAGGVALSPPESDPTGLHGFYVNDLHPTTPLPVYSILLQHKSTQKPRSEIARLDCLHYWTGAFALRGDLYPKIGLRMRGASVCMTPKPYLKLRFQRGRELAGQRKLNLQSLWTDKSLVRERLSWDVFQDLGMPSCRAEYVRVHSNGQYYGLFTALENVDGNMLERNGFDPDGSLYKSVGSNEEPNGGSPGPWEKKTNENGDFSDLQTFLRDLHDTSVTRLRTFFGTSTDADRIIDYQLGQILINNTDYAGHNHFLYREPAGGKWIPLPWDLDLTFGKAGVFDDIEWIPGFSPWYTTAVNGEFQSFLLDRFFSDAGSWFRRAYLVRLHDALQERFTVEFYESRLNALKTLLQGEQEEDIRMWGRLTDQVGGQFPREFLPNLERVRFYVRERRQYLISYLSSRSNVAGHARLKITELNYNPPGQDDRLEFIELWNPSDQPVSLAGWSIEGVGFVWPEGARADANEVLVVARDPAAFEARHGRPAEVYGPYEGSLANEGEILRVKDKGQGHPATVDMLRYAPEGGWPREANGLGRSLELTEVGAWRDNDSPGNWRASIDLGGSPGVISGVSPAGRRYRRGDSSADGQINLADAIAILGYLFLGTGEPACAVASDLNGVGGVKLDDAVFLLRYLFLGAPDPIPFPGPNDCAPTLETACRVSNCV